MTLDKSMLRARLRKRRRSLARACPDAAIRAAANLPIDRLPPFAVVAGYHPIGAELDPAPLLARLAGRGAALVFPVVNGAGRPLRFERADDGREAFPDLIVAPLIGFDRAGGRLGQGGGHYDRTLAALRALGPMFVIGLAYAGQEVEAVPHEVHDQTLDAILTELGYREVRKDTECA
jgi:5-formyltetrahydrofolate cyclo-ligase